MPYHVEFLQHWTSRCAEFRHHWTSNLAEFLKQWTLKKNLTELNTILDVKTCRIYVHLSRQTLNNFCNIGRHTLQNFCKEWNWKKKRITILIKFFPLNYTKCCSFEETHFLNSWKLKHFAFITFEKFPYFVPKYCCFEANILLCLEKSMIFCGIDMKNIPERSIFQGECYFGKHKIVWKAFYLFSKFHLEFRISNFFLGPWDRITFLFHVITL